MTAIVYQLPVTPEDATRHQELLKAARILSDAGVTVERLRFYAALRWEGAHTAQAVLDALEAEELSLRLTAPGVAAILAASR